MKSETKEYRPLTRVEFRMLAWNGIGLFAVLFTLMIWAFWGKMFEYTGIVMILHVVWGVAFAAFLSALATDRILTLVFPDLQKRLEEEASKL